MSNSIEIKSEDFLRIFLVFWLIGAIISFILLFFLPNVVAAASIWEFSDGWQRELGLWSAGMIFGIIYALLLNKLEINKFLTIFLIAISAIIGSYHLYALILFQAFTLMDFFWILSNYSAVVFGIYVIYLNMEKKY
ncbi:MAG: hypothetical protein ACTSVV_08885 [Promethearchaeota archaeon]